MKLIELFPEISLNPSSAKDIKQWILQLAVEGKLTKKWRDENPIEFGTELLKEIIDYNLKVYKVKVKPEINIDNHSELPKSWNIVKTKDILTLRKGKNPKDLSETVKTFPYLDIEALDRKNIRRWSDDEKAPKCTSNDLLVVCDGSRSGLVLKGENGILGSTLAIIQTHPKIQVFIKILFQALFLELNTSMKGAAIPHLDTKALTDKSIGLPPLEEQHAIVSIVESLFKEVDELEAQATQRIALKRAYAIGALQQVLSADTQEAWKQLVAVFPEIFNDKQTIKTLRETILQLAVQGKLTAKWRSASSLEGGLEEGEISSFEGFAATKKEGDKKVPKEGNNQTAHELLAQIKAEKAQLIKEKKLKAEKPLPPIEAADLPAGKAGVPFELPEGWVWCRMRDISYSIVPNRDKPQSFSGNITWLTTRNLKENSNKIWNKIDDNKLSREEIIKYNSRLLPRNSVIMCCVGTFGLSAVLDEEYTCNQQLHCFVTLGTMNPFYVDYTIKFNREKLQNESNATTIAYLNQTKCDSIVLSLPSPKEQQIIVEKVNALMSLCDELEREVEGLSKTEDLLKLVMVETNNRLKY